MGGERPTPVVASFDGLGVGFVGPQGNSHQRNPSDNSLAVGPDHIVQTINTRVAIFTKAGAKYAETGKVLYGPVASNNVFRGFGGACEANNNGDVVVRYDQLVDRWLLVMPIFLRVAPSTTPPGPRAAPLFIPPAPAPGDTARPRPAPSPEPADGKYAMCYAVSETSDPRRRPGGCRRSRASAAGTKGSPRSTTSATCSSMPRGRSGYSTSRRSRCGCSRRTARRSRRSRAPVAGRARSPTPTASAPPPMGG